MPAVASHGVPAATDVAHPLGDATIVTDPFSTTSHPAPRRSRERMPRALASSVAETSASPSSARSRECSRPCGVTISGAVASSTQIERAGVDDDRQRDRSGCRGEPPSRHPIGPPHPFPTRSATPAPGRRRSPSRGAAAAPAWSESAGRGSGPCPRRCATPPRRPGPRRPDRRPTRCGCRARLGNTCRRRRLASEGCAPCPAPSMSRHGDTLPALEPISLRRRCPASPRRRGVRHRRQRRRRVASCTSPMSSSMMSSRNSTAVVSPVLVAHLREVTPGAAHQRERVLEVGGLEHRHHVVDPLRRDRPRDVGRGIRPLRRLQDVLQVHVAERQARRRRRSRSARSRAWPPRARSCPASPSRAASRARPAAPRRPWPSCR